MAVEPGQSFNYNSGASELLAYIFRKATGKDIEEYAAENLFLPLGIDHYFLNRSEIEGSKTVDDPDIDAIRLRQADLDEREPFRALIPPVGGIDIERKKRRFTYRMFKCRDIIVGIK